MTTQPLAAGFDEKSYADWCALAEKALRGEPLASLSTQTADGFDYQPIYPGRKDVARIPYTQGVNPWLITARADHPDAETANRFLLEELEGGANQIALVFADSASGYGYGLPPQADLGVVLKDVIADAVAIRIEPRLLPLSALGEIGQSLKKAAANLNCHLDPIGQFARWGSAPESLDAWAGVWPGLHQPMLEADGRIYHNTGATPGQELAAILSTYVAYLRMADNHGLPLEAVMGKLSCCISVDQDQFMSIAKLRALRLLIDQIQASLTDISPINITIHAETSLRMMAHRDVPSNILRTTIAAMAAGLGGAFSLSVLPFTQGLGLPESFARRVARNTQLLAMEESHIHQIEDPAAGSGALEALTDKLAASAWRQFQDIEQQGGIVESLRAGHLQASIKTARGQSLQQLLKGDTALIGTSIFDIEEKTQPAICDTIERQPGPVIPSPALTCEALEPLRLATEFENVNS